MEGTPSELSEFGHLAGSPGSPLCRAVLESMADGLIVVSHSGLVVGVNPAAQEMFGYSADETVGWNISRLLGELDWPAPFANGIRRDLRTLRKDGTCLSVEITLNEVPIEGHNFLAIIARDISQRKQVEFDLQRSEALSKAVLESAVDGITVIDDAGLIQSFNPAAERLFGWKAEEILGKNVSLLIPSPHRAMHDHYIHSYLATGTRKIIGTGREVEGLRKDGVRFPVHLSIGEMKVGEQRLFAGITRDITQEKAARQELAEKNLELEAASRIDRISSQVLLAFSTGQDGNCCEQILQILAQEAGYRPLALYLFDEWHDRLELAASVDLPPGNTVRSMAPGQGLVGGAAARRESVILDAPQTDEFTLDTGIGLLRPGTIFAIPLIHREKLLGILAGASPVALRKRERSWLMQLADQVAVGLRAQSQFQEMKLLSEQLNQRNRRIAQQNRELERANQLKSQFLANMSHELRTPLNAVIGFSEVLKDGLLGHLEEQQLDYVSEIYASGKHLLSLINDILDLSKIEAGKMELELETLSVESVLDNALIILRERALKERVTLVKAIDPEIGDILADGRKLRQIIYNLLSNAVKFTPEGGRVCLEAHIVGDSLEFAVRDTGIGIAAEALERLFRPFEQLEGGADRRYEGTGLGLALCKSLVELQGGTIGVESKPGAGSLFWFRLPRRAGVQHPLSLAAPPSDPRSDSPVVLAVDADEDALGLVCRWLEKDGYCVKGVTTAEIAWETLQRRAPDVVLLDIVSSQETAWELLSRLKSSPETANIPVVLISMACDRDRGLALGALEVLEKPVSQSKLDALLRTLGKAGVARESGEILVVDDDPRAVEHVARRLEGSGFTVARAYTGREALELLDSGTFQLVILDLMMPEITGFDVLREMRARRKTSETPVVVLTAKTLSSVERLELQRQVSGVLTKASWDEGAFLREVRRALLRRKQRPSGMAVEVELNRHQGGPPPLVLVVAQDATTRGVLKLYLSDAGFGVVTASDTLEAGHIMERSAVDLLAVDIKLSGPESLAMLDQLARSQKDRSIPVLLVKEAEDPNHLCSLAASGLLSKPVQRHELLALARRLIQRPTDTDHCPLVMVVDDDPRALKMVRRHFEGEGFVVLSALGSQEALDLALQQTPDLVVTDLVMPEISGFELIENLRKQPETSSVPIVVLTSASLTASEVDSLQGTVARVLAKGNTGRDEFLAEVHRALKGPRP